MAQRFEAASGTLSGDVQSLARGLENDVSTWHMDASASEDGLLIFGSGALGDLQLVWLDRDTKQISVIADKVANLQYAAISPQGDRLALQIDSGINDIWSLDLARGVRTRLTFGPVANTYPVWSPDGKWIAYGSTRPGSSGIFRKIADGSGAEEALISNPDPTGFIPSDWSRDGKTLFYSTGLSTGDQIIWALPLNGER